MSEEKIQIEWYPISHANKAYEAGYYIEAIQVVHAFLELQTRELIFIINGRTEPHEDFDLATDSMFDIGLSVAVKVLFIQGILSKSERDQLTHFNKMRNLIVHEIFSDSKGGERSGVSREKYDDAFKIGISMMEVLAGKIYVKMEGGLSLDQQGKA